MDNKSAFNVIDYDENIRKVIPLYDKIYDQIFSLISVHCGSRPISLLDTGCGTGTLAKMAFDKLNLSQLVLCDPSEKMLGDAKAKLAGHPCEFVCAGSQELDFDDRFDVVTAIQSHHYFDRQTREKALANCFKSLKSGGIFVCFENTAPFTELGRKNMLRRLEAFELSAGRSYEDVKAHSARYGTEFFPITITDHLELLSKTGFTAAELFWHSYMQSGFYAIKN